jgi:hypothetical protein
MPCTEAREPMWRMQGVLAEADEECILSLSLRCLMKATEWLANLPQPERDEVIGWVKEGLVFICDDRDDLVSALKEVIDRGIPFRCKHSVPRKG